ncbi:Ankyrin repeat and KH domain-containing protein mask [Symbiodinium microadriaticum]|uniref:Ankyrin repeat and KH domain-containing protein mask n=1 Tax=Symbiodinium microadriaticum TaxID=2951 RepID=A0A1Q9CTP0_SYMMI|nr:Ankyrin repeat and KH domain-containing protein mask [Symbiodinium microadriaticum]CAE7871849.1 mask [Symbiodinium microadriaticum]CAE7940955.1 mask [Symbiodinium sp. KB8]
MLHIWKASGELLLATPVNELSDVRALKRQLRQLTGVPRFRQRILKDSAILEDAARLDGPADLQLLQLPFCSTSYKQVIELHEAVENGNVSVVEDILQRPQNPELQLEDGSDWDSDEDGSVLDDYRHAPLTVASRAGRTEIAEMLLEAGADQDGLFELNGHDAYTPLCAACDCGSQEIVNLLLKSAAQPNGISRNGATKPLCVAARSGCLNIVRTLLEANADKDAKDAAGETALCEASRHGHLNVAIFLLDMRADIDAVSEVGDELAWHPNRFGEAPISAASEMGHVDVVRFLLSAHAFVEARNAKSETPLWKASICGHLETARLLLNAFAEPDVFDRHGRTPLCAACLAGHLSVAALLVDVGADRDAFDEFAAEDDERRFFTWARYPRGGPLWAATCRGDVEMVRLLLSASANTESKTRNGETPLLGASRERRTEIVQLLLRASACTDAGDDHGETPLCAASAAGCLPVVRLLLEAGADPTLPNSGETPYRKAAIAGHAQVCKLLRAKAGVADALQLEISNKRQKKVRAGEPTLTPRPVLIDPATLPKVDTIVDKLQRQKEQEAAEKAKMAAAELAQRAEVARLMETLTPVQVLHILGEMQRLTLRAPDVARALLAENSQLSLALQHAQFLAGMLEGWISISLLATSWKRPVQFMIFGFLALVFVFGWDGGVCRAQARARLAQASKAGENPGPHGVTNFFTNYDFGHYQASDFLPEYPSLQQYSGEGGTARALAAKEQDLLRNVTAVEMFQAMDRGWVADQDRPAPQPYWRPETNPPWGSAVERASSARRKPTQSPRRRPKGKEKGKKNGGQGQAEHPGKGKGAANPVPAPAVPSLDALPGMPAKPALPAVANPRPAAPTVPTADRQALDALVQTLVSAKMPIPPETQALLDQMRHEDAQSDAKNMHRAVSSQAAARKDLVAIRSLRAHYMQEWSAYLVAISELLDKQVEEQAQTLAGLDDREQQAVDCWLKAKADLARLTADTTQDKESDEIDAAEAMVEDSIEIETYRREAREAAQAHTEKLQVAIRGLRTQAVEQAEEAKREGSRTPRRRPRDPAIDLTKDETSHKDKQPAEATKQPPG